MGNAFRKEFTGFDGRDDPVLQEAAGAISCRLLVGLLRSSIKIAVQNLGADSILSSPDTQPTAVHARCVRRTSQLVRYLSRCGRSMYRTGLRTASR